MRCPGCRNEMTSLELNAVLGGRVDVHACTRCRAFWFEPFETLHLTRPSTLTLFKFIADHNATPNAAFPEESYCPRCESRLLLTHDRRGNTAFQYWRCDRGHGRFTSFIDFLREKDFIRPLSPQQIADLRKEIEIIHCSNCGAPVDLTRESACSHCGAPLSMLDMKKMIETATGQERAAPPAFPEHRDLDFAALLAATQHTRPTLVDLGLGEVVKWLARGLERFR